MSQIYRLLGKFPRKPIGQNSKLILYLVHHQTGLELGLLNVWNWSRLAYSRSLILVSNQVNSTNVVATNLVIIYLLPLLLVHHSFSPLTFLP